MPTSKRFSREGFKRLARSNSDENNMAPSHPSRGQGNPNDVTIDIPLTKVQTSRSTGARKNQTLASNIEDNDKTEVLDEKQNVHFNRGAGRRKKFEEQGKKAVKNEDGTLTMMGKIYDKIYHFSVVTRYLLYVAPVALCIAVPIIVGATAAPNARIGGTRITWFFTWIEIVWCSIWASKLVVHFLPYLFQFIVGVVSSGTRKYALILAALEIPLSLVGWAVVNLVTFRPLMTRTPGRAEANYNWIGVMEKILAACVFATLILLVEKVLIQLISISYHRKQFDAKIQDSKRNIFLLTQLYDASKAMFPTYCPDFAEEDYIISDVLGITSIGTPGKRKSGTVTPMRLIQNVQRVGEQVTSAFGHMAADLTGKQIFNPTASHSTVILALEKRRSSEALARRLWLSFVLEGKEALYLEDVIDVLGHDREEEAEEIFTALDIDGNGDISLDEMVLRVSEFGRERAALANSMRDVDQAICVLDNLLMTVVFVMVVFVFVAWLNQSFTTTLATAGTALLSLSFVFSATAQELLGSCIFLFVKHPYDVGDRVDISNEQLVVERISLLYTMFRRVKDHKRTQVPNIVLNSLWVDNVSRSKAMREQVTLAISFDTTFEDIELLREEMQKFVRENGRDYQPEIDIEVLDLPDMAKLQLKIECRHKSNWSIESVRAARRSKFMCALVQALRRVPIYAPGGGTAVLGDKANPSYSVAISDPEARENAEQYSKDKEAKRMTPTEKAEEATATSSSVDFFGDSSNETRERVNADALKTTKVVVDPSGQGREDYAASALTRQRTSIDRQRSSLDRQRSSHDRQRTSLDRQRTNDLEEVKNIMRRESTRGRRKITQHVSYSPIAEVPTPSYEPPSGLSGSTAQNQSSAPQVNYFPEFPTTSSSTSYPAQLNTESAGRVRADSNALTPPTYEGPVPGNAFSQKQSSTRQPVSGVGQMKGALRQPQSEPGQAGPSSQR